MKVSESSEVMKGSIRRNRGEVEVVEKGRGRESGDQAQLSKRGRERDVMNASGGE